MKPKKIGEELQPEYPNHQITAARINELGKQIKNQKTPENSLVQQLRESLAESSFFNETKYNKDGDINNHFRRFPSQPKQIPDASYSHCWTWWKQ
ncbi:hypothetical protein PSTT_15320 [Puccinia striiformis]|uniref:Uncharacterized protein n=1 Tax=Puccinia striiformis TaxID=27350 RepID=A0A2S4UIP7_9BASI|nr:hypothetical protein PSTT_15320 [Puccinia striiformis]